MSRSPIQSHVDVLRPGVLKEKIDTMISDGELDRDSHVADDVGDDSQTHDVFRQINDEVNLEVAIRERLASTIEGRIQWALQMLDALSHVNEPQDQPLDGDDFQEAALDALEALEEPSSFLFDTVLPEERSPSPSFSPVVANPPLPQRVPKTRSSRTPKPSQQKKYLYIRLPSASGSQLAILACPTCDRTQFTTLQGLFNHARLAHGIEWASHDACIAACASLVSADDQSWESYESDGVEVPWGGNVVGLRRLFERAVGVDGTLPMLTSSHAVPDDSLGSPGDAPSTLLSRTLGLHADSHSLAQFLGRAPKRRCIHVYDEDQPVDIMALDSMGSPPGGLFSEEFGRSKKGFYMRYPHRNAARKDLDLVVDVDAGDGVTNVDNTSCSAIVPGTAASRFRISARVRLEDRSLFMKADRRAQLGIADQYRWMLGVTAPSYSLPLASFLTCVTVIPPRSVSPVFLTVQKPPFAVLGTANEPFMAKVVFEWVGGGKMQIEHWVESLVQLDQHKSPTSVLGSQQLLDVELNRKIPLLPVPKGNPPPLPSLDRQDTPNALLCNTLQIDPESGDTTTKEEYYEQVLRSLLPRVPMTAKDVKARRTHVPYKLVASPAHLLALVPGRRKAIEWARARALHELYIDHVASISPPQRTTLTAGDVYMFLEDASLFPRPSHPVLEPHHPPKKKVRKKDGTPVVGEEYCPICGIKKHLHSGYDTKSEENVVPWSCAVVSMTEQRCGMRLPLTNLAKNLTWRDGLEQAVWGPPSSTTSSVDIPNQTLRVFLPPYQNSPHVLVSGSPPELILAVYKVISKLHLPTFPDFPTHEENSAFLRNRQSTEQCLAPAALLSATLRPFASTLLRSAIEVAKRDAATSISWAKGSQGNRVKKLNFVLTPGHILRGLRLRLSDSLKVAPGVSRTAMINNPRARESASLCLAQLGVPLDFGKYVQTKLAAFGEEQSGHVTVKAEPE